jgi:ribosomal protein S21
MGEFKRKKGETFETFLRRFNKSLIKSRKLALARKNRYHKSDRTKNKQKEYALMVMDKKGKTEYLKKIGKYKEEPRGRW